MRECGRQGCGQYTLTHPTLCYFDAKRDAGLYEPERAKVNKAAERSVVINDETEALCRTMAAMGATELQVRIALRQVNHGRPTLRSMNRERVAVGQGA